MIPDYQSLMLPLLKKLADKQEHKFRDLIEELAFEFKLTEEERQELLQSG
jgi:restriction system protein